MIPFFCEGEHLAIPLYIHDSSIGLLAFTDTDIDTFTSEDSEFILGTLDMLRHHYEITIEFNELKIVDEQIQKVLQDSPLSYQSLDENGLFIDVNDKWLDTLGYEKNEVIGSWFGDYLDEQGRADFTCNFAHFKAMGEIHDVIFHMRTKSGEFKTVSYNGTIRTDSEGKFVQTYGLYRDITATKILTEALMDNKAKYQALFDNNNSIMLLIDPEDRRILEANNAALDFYGYSQEELLKLSINEINTLPEIIIQDSMESIKSHKDISFTFSHRLKNGDIKQVEAFSSPIIIKGKTLLFSIINDITLRLEMEEMIRQGQKMDAIGQLTAGIAHDFNNLLAAIMGYAELIQLEDHSKKISEYIGQILIGCNRSKQLIKQLLSYTRKSPTNKLPLNIHDLIHELTNLLEHTISKTIIIHKSLEADLPMLTGDSNQMHTAILNLTLNSRDAIGGNGIIEIHTENCLLTEEERSELSIDADTLKFLKLIIKDDGCGMTEEISNKIFDPFYTTKPEGSGTGMGLSAVWGIIKDHQGAITVESELGIGTTFTILLPIFN